jgi:hypothetical protein
MMGVDRIVYIFWLCFMLLTGIPGLVLFTLHRDTTVIRVRGFWSVILQLSFAMLWAFSMLMVYIFGIQPFPTPMIYFFLFANVTFLLERCLMLFVSFRITTQSIQRAQDKFLFSAGQTPFKEGHSLQSKVYKWLLANRRFFHQGLLSYSKLTAFSFALLWSFPSAIAGALLSDEEASKLSDSVLNLFYIIFLILISVCSYCLRPVQENFKIKSELKRLAVLGVAVLFITISVTFFTNWDKTQPVITFSAEMCLLMAEIWLCLIRVVLLAKGIEVKLKRTSNSHERQRLNSTASVSNNPGSERRNSSAEKPSNSHYLRLLVMLEDEKLRAKFEKFLVKEFAVEGILFWKAVEYFRSNFPEITAENRKAALDAATAIFDEFCSPNANMCINISFGCRQELIQAFNLASKVQDVDSAAEVTIKPDTFDSAVKEVLTLLAQDSFRRFAQQVRLDKTSVASALPLTKLSSVSVEAVETPIRNMEV